MDILKLPAKQPVPAKQQRNAPCLCGSGVKYKKCCFQIELEVARLEMIERKKRYKEFVEQLAKERQQKMTDMAKLDELSSYHPSKGEDLRVHSSILGALMMMSLNRRNKKLRKL